MFTQSGPEAEVGRTIGPCCYASGAANHIKGFAVWALENKVKELTTFDLRCQDGSTSATDVIGITNAIARPGEECARHTQGAHYKYGRGVLFGFGDNFHLNLRQSVPSNCWLGGITHP